MSITPAVHLKPIVPFREFPFGTASDPSMQEFMRDQPWPNQDHVLDYLRSGVVLSVTMGASLTDWFDRPNKANPVINGQTEGGTTEMTDGVWFWYAGLIHFIEKYNVRVSEEFLWHAEQQGWRVDDGKVSPARYECSYFAEQP